MINNLLKQGSGTKPGTVHNITTVVAEERLGMFVVRPASLIKVTGLPVT